MNWLAWKMLTGDRAKYLGIVFGVSFGSLLIAQQSAIFVGLMRRTSSQILDIREADRWAMDAAQAVGLFRGDTEQEIALRFERLEPYVIPKRSLTGDAMERVDTRVLQVLSEIVAPAEPATLFVGQ